MVRRRVWASRRRSSPISFLRPTKVESRRGRPGGALMTFNSRRDVRFRRVRKVIRTSWPVWPSSSVKIENGRESRPCRAPAQGTEFEDRPLRRAKSELNPRSRRRSGRLRYSNPYGNGGGRRRAFTIESGLEGDGTIATIGGEIQKSIRTFQSNTARRPQLLGDLRDAPLNCYSTGVELAGGGLR